MLAIITVLMGRNSVNHITAQVGDIKMTCPLGVYEVLSCLRMAISNTKSHEFLTWRMIIRTLDCSGEQRLVT